MPISLGNSGNTATYDPMGYALAEEKLAFEKEQAEKQLREQRIQRMFQSGMSAAQAVNANMQREKDRQFQATQAARAQQDRLAIQKEGQRFTTDERVATQNTSRSNFLDNEIINARTRNDGMIAGRSKDGFVLSSSQEGVTFNIKNKISEHENTLAEMVKSGNIAGANRVRNELLSEYGKLDRIVPERRVLEPTVMIGGVLHYQDPDGRRGNAVPILNDQEQRDLHDKNQRMIEAKWHSEIKDRFQKYNQAAIEAGVLDDPVRGPAFLRNNLINANIELENAGYDHEKNGTYNPGTGAIGGIPTGDSMRFMGRRERASNINFFKKEIDNKANEFRMLALKNDQPISAEEARSQAIEFLYSGEAATKFLESERGGPLFNEINRRRGHVTREEAAERTAEEIRVRQAEIDEMQAVMGGQPSDEYRNNYRLRGPALQAEIDFLNKRQKGWVSSYGQYSAEPTLSIDEAHKRGLIGIPKSVASEGPVQAATQKQGSSPAVMTNSPNSSPENRWPEWAQPKWGQPDKGAGWRPLPQLSPYSVPYNVTLEESQYMLEENRRIREERKYMQRMQKLMSPSTAPPPISPGGDLESQELPLHSPDLSYQSGATPQSSWYGAPEAQIGLDYPNDYELGTPSNLMFGEQPSYLGNPVMPPTEDYSLWA